MSLLVQVGDSSLMLEQFGGIDMLTQESNVNSVSIIFQFFS